MRTTRIIVSLALTLSCLFVYPTQKSAGRSHRSRPAIANAATQKAIQEKLAQVQTDQVKLDASFDSPVPASDVSRVLANKQVKVEYLTYRSGEHTAWYVLKDGESVADAVTTFGQQHAQFLLEQIVNNQVAAMSVGDPSKAQRQLQASRAQQAQEFVDQLNEYKSQGLMLSGFAVTGTKASLPALMEAIPEAKTSLKPVDVSKTDGGNRIESSASVQATSSQPYSDPWKFSPTIGTISYNASQRYIRSDFTFSDISGFTSVHSAYEHDITIWSNKDTYVKPGPGSYYSNLPAAYVDNTFDDTYSLFTIGSEAATSIRANTSYYTQLPVQVINPNAPASSGDIQPQLGSWAGMYDDGGFPAEWLEQVYCGAAGGKYADCIFADQTYTIKNYYPSGGGASVTDFPFDYHNSFTYSWNKQAATPTINPGSASSIGPVTATISTATSGATIRYTTNGTDPTSSSMIYTGPLTFTTSVTLSARAFKSGLSDSNVAAVSYSILQKAATPTITPGSGSYLGSVSASISTSTPGATIRYTTNGSDPTSSSAVYSVPLSFTSSVTLKARAFKSGLTDSDVATVTYSVSAVQKVSTPTISPGSGSYSGSVSASISTSTSGATIRYTTNGTDPTSSSTVYSGPLAFSSSATLKARAFKSGMNDSDVATATYSIAAVQKVSTPTISPSSGTYSGSVSANIATSTSGATIRYTTNGTDPTSSSAVYSGSLTFTSSVTLKARAFKSGMSDSDVATVSYTIQTIAPLAVKCSISPSPVTVNTGATVSAQASGGFPTYRYRINGVDTGTVSSLLVVPSQVGTFTTSVVVTDSRSSQASASCSVQVNVANPYVTGFRYSPNPAKATQVVSLDIYGGNFVAGSTQVWFVGPGCSAPGCQTLAVNVGSPAYIAAAAVLNLTGTYTVNIRNGNGIWVQAGTVTVVW